MLAGLTLAYFAAGKLGLAFAAAHVSASAVWPPTGIALATCLVLGYGVWPAVLAGAFLVNVTTTGAVFSSAAIAGGNTIECLLAAYLVNRFARGADCFQRARDVFRFSTLAALATTVSATVGAASLALSGEAQWAQFASLWLTWWLGDAAGALLVAPPLVLWYQRPHLDMPPERLAEGALTLIAVLAVGVVCFAVPALSRYPLVFLCLPPLAWLALRFSQREVATATLALAVIAVVTTGNGLGPFAVGTRHESLLVLQAFMGTIAMMMLPMAALVGEVARAMGEREEAALQERRARAEAEAATRSKDEFLAMLSHELRNPLQAINTSTLLLEMRRGSPEHDARALDVIKRQTENLTRMVNDLLDVARAIAGKIVVVRQAVDLDKSLRHCLELLEGSGRLEHHAVDVRSEPLMVNADPTRLEQMLMNLLGTR